MSAEGSNETTTPVGNLSNLNKQYVQQIIGGQKLRNADNKCYQSPDMLKNVSPKNQPLSPVRYGPKPHQDKRDPMSPKSRKKTIASGVILSHEANDIKIKKIKMIDEVGSLRKTLKNHVGKRNSSNFDVSAESSAHYTKGSNTKEKLSE